MATCMTGNTNKFLVLVLLWGVLRELYCPIKQMINQAVQNSNVTLYFRYPLIYWSLEVLCSSAEFKRMLPNISSEDKQFSCFNVL